MGRYDEINVDSTSTLLKMITGDVIKFRRKDEFIIIDNPSGSVFFLVQGDRAMSMYSTESNMDSGFVARMLPVFIGTNQGEQREEYEEEPLSPLKLMNIGTVFENILNMGETFCSLSSEAAKARVDFNNKMQKRFKGDLKNHFDEFNKMVSFSVQIACLFAVLDNDGKKVEKVNLEQYRRAVIYTEYRIDNALLFINSYATKRLYEGAQELIDWLNKAKKEHPSRRRYFNAPFKWFDLKNNMSNKRQKDNINIYKSLLTQHGFVKEIKGGLIELLWHYE